MHNIILKKRLNTNILWIGWTVPEGCCDSPANPEDMTSLFLFFYPMLCYCSFLGVYDVKYAFPYVHIADLLFNKLTEGNTKAL